MKILLAADGSDYTRKAARCLASRLDWLKEIPDVHVVHVRPPIPYPGAAAAIGKTAIDDYEREEAQVALKVATAELAGTTLKPTTSYSVGDVARELHAYVKKHRIDLVVAGSHGHGALANLALGSVATKLLATLEVPVVIVR